MTTKQRKVTVQTFIDENPLWKVLKVKDGGKHLSYKSSGVLYLVECKNCSNQTERKGNVIGQCTRCKHSLSYNDEDGFEMHPPEDEDDIRIAAENLKKPPKKLTALESDVEVDEKVVTTRAKAKPAAAKPSRAAPVESEEEEPEEEAVEDKAPGLNIAKLVEIASKSSGLKSKAQRDAEIAKKEAYGKHRKNKIERQIQEDAEADANIDEEEEMEEEIPRSLLPAKKKAERSKVEDRNLEEKPCVQVKITEMTMNVVKLKPGQTFFCKVTNTLFIVDDE